MGDIACTRHRTRAGRDDGGTPDERKDRDIAVTIMMASEGLCSSFQHCWRMGVFWLHGRVDKRLQ
jgi:hypothetical protein